MNDDAASVLAAIKVAFGKEAAMNPALSLRGGNAIDNCVAPPPYDAVADSPIDAYLEKHAWGIGYLDADSFKHYLPRLAEYTLERATCGSLAGEAFLAALRPPDLDPPKLASFSVQQEKTLVAFLDLLAFSEASAHQESALTALEEWWAPGPLYRSQNAV